MKNEQSDDALYLPDDKRGILAYFRGCDYRARETGGPLCLDLCFLELVQGYIQWRQGGAGNAI